MGHLPAEVWCDIADYLPPSALDAVTSTSTTLRRILLPSVAIKRHRALKEQYGTCTCGDGQSNGELTRLAVNVFLRPELGLYIKELTIIDWSNHVPMGEWGVYLSLSRNSYQEALDAAHQGTESVEEYLRRLRIESGIFILLLRALPELRSLCMLGWPSHASLIGAAVERARGIGYEPLPPPILPNLQKVLLRPSATKESWPDRTVNAFAGLPTVKEIITLENTEGLGSVSPNHYSSTAIEGNKPSLTTEY